MYQLTNTFVRTNTNVDMPTTTTGWAISDKGIECNTLGLNFKKYAVNK
jgi:hypothetical protein